MFFFNPASIEKKLEESLYEARREHLHHSMSAAHHQALAEMYGARVEWLLQQQRGASQSAAGAVSAS